MAEEEGGETGDLRLRVEDRGAEVGELNRERIAGEKIETLERLRVVTDPRARHVEAADREAVPRQMLREPREKSPVLESLETVNDDHQRARILRHVEIPPDGKAFIGVDREIHRLPGHPVARLPGTGKPGNWATGKPDRSTH